MPIRRPSPLLFTLLLVGATVTYLEVRRHQDANPLDIEMAAPSFTLVDLASPHDTLTLQSFAGQVLVLEAWARSCENCKYSMPALDSVADTLRGRGVKVVHVALEELADSTAVRAFVEKFGGPGGIVAMDQNEVFRTNYVVTGLPTGYLIDRRGRLRWQGYSVSHELSRPAGARLMETMIAER